MKIDGSNISYLSGQKNHWRRWMWNRIVERLPKGVKPKDATVLYLAGRENLDHDEAMRRGFKAANLIAVERDRGVVSELRKSGVTTLHMPLDLAIMGWPKNRQIDVVIADFCCGITDSMRPFVAALLSAQCMGAVVATNFQRGREPGELVDELKRLCVENVNQAPDIKHRGKLFTAWVAFYFGVRFREAYEQMDCPELFADFARSFAVHAESFRPSLNSYRQAHCKVIMDSCIFNMPGRAQGAMTLECSGFNGATKKGLSIKRKVTAALAVQTMRLNGTLKAKSA